MPIRHHVDSNGVLIVERTGHPDLAEEDVSFEARSLDPAVIPGMRVLVDSRGVSPSDDCDVIKHVAAAVRSHAARLGCGPVALLVKSDAEYGMARMYEALTEVVHPKTRVFRDYDEAMRWLLSEPAEVVMTPERAGESCQG